MSHPLQLYREANNLTLEAVAGSLKVSTATISRIENDKQKVTAEMAIAIESATAIPRHELRPDLWPPANAEAAE